MTVTSSTLWQLVVLVLACSLSSGALTLRLKQVTFDAAQLVINAIIIYRVYAQVPQGTPALPGCLGL